jgi:hypothetical protein
MEMLYSRRTTFPRRGENFSLSLEERAGVRTVVQTIHVLVAHRHGIIAVATPSVRLRLAPGHFVGAEVTSL